MSTDRSSAHLAGNDPPDLLRGAHVEGSALELVVFSPDGAVRHRLPKSGRVTVGRGDDADITIRDGSVSRSHARVTIEGARVWIEDLGSTNGTSVRSARMSAMSSATLDPREAAQQRLEALVGDRIVFGSITAVIRRVDEVSVSGVRSAAPAAGGEIVVRAPAMTALYKQARLAAQAPISVLILGETGVGKEVLARAVHEGSPRSRRPFLALNCAALSESLLESELFGHEKGAFTGAVQARPGLFESAEGGTIFLDEVGELPVSIQVKLLRTLEERTVMRVGGRSAIPIDVRFVSATNRDLEAEVAKGAFRSDLFFRLNGIALTIPPLRERVEDVVPLACLFAAKVARQLDRPRAPEIAQEAVAVLERYGWPGNIRELRNVIERAVVLCEGSTIWPEHLPEKLVTGVVTSPSPVEITGTGLREPPSSRQMGGFDRRSRRGPDEAERQRIVEALEACGGNQTQAAERLGMSRRTMVSRLEEYGVARPRKKL